MALTKRPSLSEDDCYSYVCAICQDVGELLCCEQCGQGFHLSCLSLDKMTDDALWLCNNCKDNKDAEKCYNFEEYLRRLPVPEQFCEFRVPRVIHEFVKKWKNRPQPFIHIRRNIYLVKKPKKRQENEFMQCACSRAGKPRESCERDCICSMLQYSCSDGCGCGPSCTNLPFQKRIGRKLDLVKTEKCGWGIVAAERIKAGDFLIEYVGEVIDDKTCEERLWGIKERRESNFYMCEINREMVIDATFKGNISRFINHSCCPNTQLQKWQIDEEVRIGVFAISDIAAGEAITYDYQFIPFGQDQTCFCGASACRGKLGRKPSKQKISSSVALQVVRNEVFGARPTKRSRPCGFQPGNGYKPIDQIFRQRKFKFAGANHYGALVPLIPQKRSPTAISCLGIRVRIWWPLDKRFYSGKIIEFNNGDCTHKVEYDDGECEVLHMDQETWELEEPMVTLKRKREVSLDTQPSEESHSLASSILFVNKDYHQINSGGYSDVS